MQYPLFQYFKLFTKLRYYIFTRTKRQFVMYNRRICISFSKVMQTFLINEVYVQCIMHDLCISFPKMWERYRKDMQKKQNKKEICRVPTRHIFCIMFSYEPRNFFFLLCFLCIIYAYFTERDTWITFLVFHLLVSSLFPENLKVFLKCVMMNFLRRLLFWCI